MVKRISILVLPALLAFQTAQADSKSVYNCVPNEEELQAYAYSLESTIADGDEANPRALQVKVFNLFGMHCQSAPMSVEALSSQDGSELIGAGCPETSWIKMSPAVIFGRNGQIKLGVQASTILLNCKRTLTQADPPSVIKIR